MTKPWTKKMATKKSKLQFKKWFVHDWEAKLVAVVLAFLLWYVVKDQVIRGRRINFPLTYPPVGTAKA